ncbi:MAG: imidazole glycerol phosphate synthase subunit HisH [Clostridia bacterium]|nr:imidazole glycerol phosphate synthase subunit HisH [Clostridia bacterium]
MVAVIDYGVGNLFSLCSSLDAIGADSVVTSDKEIIRRADRIILPGVGAFADAIAKLRESGLDKVIKEEAMAGKPIFGICLGMQLLFEKSYEYGEHEGLGLLKGSVVGMDGRIDSSLKIPHIGWNSLSFEREHPLLKYTDEGQHVYFVHSYYATDCEESIIASTEYGAKITAAVAHGNVSGMQFHPEKSGEVGLNMLRAFCEWEGRE